MSIRSLIVRFLALTISLTSTISQGAMIQSNVLKINFTDPNEAQKKAIWFPADKLNINSNGLGWNADPAELRPGEIQTKHMAVGVSWRPPAAMAIRVTILPPPKPILLNDGNMSTPYPGNVFVRYSPDLKNWSSWIILEHSYRKSSDEKKRNERCYEGSISVTQRSRNEYFKLLENYSKLDVPWKSDEEAAVRWILKQQPDWFSKNMPFIGYIEFLFESNFHGGQRIKSFKAEISYCINGMHYPPKDKNIYNKRDSIPWRFKAENKNVDEVNHADDSFETVRKKLIEQIKKDGAKIDNWGKFYNVPFKKCMESKEPLAEGSFIYKMFYDKKFHIFTVSQITEYLRKNSVSQSKRQNILNVMLKNVTLKNPWWMRIKATSILISFNKKDYNDESRKIFKDLLLRNDCDKYALFLIDCAGIYDDPEIIAFLKEKAEPYQVWSRRNKTPWFALLILARHGDKNAIKKVIKLANLPDQKERSLQILIMPIQLAYVQQPEIVELLKKFLHSKESYFNGRDCVPQRSDLSHASARALSNMIIGFPEVKSYEYPDKKRKECIEWFDKHKKYQFNQNAKILFY
jgi:hypothetical protein